MDVQSIRKIIFPAVSKAINNLEEENIDFNITMLKRVINEAVNATLNKSHTQLSYIAGEFSGRGRAWAKVDVNQNNPVWLSIKECLTQEMNSADSNSDVFKKSSGMLDLFENTGFAWMRFAGVNNKTKTVRFQLRIWGSKLEEHIKFYVDSNDYENNFISNLEGVPHLLGLESGDFSKEIIVKEKIEGNVTKEELSCLGIQTLSDLLEEDI